MDTESIPRLCTPQALSEDLERSGVDLSAERLAELADMGYIPSVSCDGKGPFFRRNEAKKWIKDNLLVEKKARAFPRELAVFDVETWEPKGRAVPPELGLICGHLREIPVAPLRWPCGVYFLIRANRVVYVGQSVVPMSRLLAHLADKEFDRILFLPVPPEHLTPIESAFIRRLKPEYNGGSQLRGPDQPWHVDLDQWFGETPEAELDRLNEHHRVAFEKRQSAKQRKSTLSDEIKAIVDANWRH